ncbi:MAG: RNA polymerase sigma factor [Planctomycetota bacterium]
MNNLAPGAYPSSTPEPSRVHSTDPEREASDREDAGWAQAVVGGDVESFDKLYLKYRDRVFAVILRVVHHREDALEGSQEVFAKVYRALSSFDPATRFYTWLYRIAMNQSIDLLRRRRVRREQSFEPELTSSTERRRHAGPEREMEAAEVRSRLAAALAELAEKHRQVFVLYSQENMNYNDIAAILNIPIGTVMSRLFYARRKLREALPQDWDPGGRRSHESREE